MGSVTDTTVLAGTAVVDQRPEAELDQIRFLVYSWETHNKHSTDVHLTSNLASNIMIDLYNTATNEMVGSITDAELQHLSDSLEEESPRDTDYYFEKGTIDLLASDGLATDHLLKLLRAALGTSDGVELRWVRREG